MPEKLIYSHNAQFGKLVKRVEIVFFIETSLNRVGTMKGSEIVYYER